MLDMATWSEERLSVLDDINLDPKNVRLETTSTQVEADIMEDLFANENVLDLVEGIAKIGYLTHEVPIVVRRRGKFVVVEGNRRVAALKAIQNPMLVPEYQGRIASLTKTISDKDALARITVKVAPDQPQADQLIAALHTSNQRRAWTPARQAAFFQAQIEAGRTYKQLIARYPMIDVRRFVFRSHMVNLFKTVRYKDPGLVDFLKSKSWQKGLSTLARIFESKDFQEITGFGMEGGVLTRTISDKTFADMATLILSDMKAGSLNTRDLNSTQSPRFLRLMADLRKIAGKSAGTDNPTKTQEPPPSTAPQPVAPPTPSGGASSRAPDGPRPTPTPTRKQKVQWLDMGHLKVSNKYPVAVRLHFEELSTTDIQKFPNSAFLMLRALLEKSVKAFAEIKEQEIKKSANEHGYVYLSHALKWLLGYVKANGEKALIQPIESVRSGQLVNYTASKDSLDAINHNHHFRVDPDEVVNMWNSIDPLMRYVMKT